MTDLPDGCTLFRGRLAPDMQAEMARNVALILLECPLFHAGMYRTNQPFSVGMSNCGPLGWYSDKDRGYRYETCHPVTGRRWPAIPDRLLRLWREVAGYDADPEACLINHYSGKAKMGLHRDQDEADFRAPIVSVSLGDSAIFRLGGLKRRDPTRSFPLHSGDVLVMGGASRLRYHGIDRILPGTSALLPGGGRINLTLRRVTLPAA
jgi:DNA oxidative demethylase